MPSPTPSPNGPAQPEPPRVRLELASLPAARDIRDVLLIKEGDLFLLTDKAGNVPPGNPDGLGLYLGDTRFLSGLELTVQGLRPTILLSSDRDHSFAVQVLTNPNLTTGSGDVVAEQSLQLRRYRRLRGAGVWEALTLENFNRFSLELRLDFRLEADFADMFAVRGLVPGAKLSPTPGEARADGLRYARVGVDGAERATLVRFEPPPDRADAQGVHYLLELPPRGQARLSLSIQVEERPSRPRPGLPRTTSAALPAEAAWLAAQPVVETSNAQFNTLWHQSRSDLRMLMGSLAPRQGGPPLLFPAAGIPWYATLFGRDSLITALFDLWLTPQLARDVLRLLADLQGQRDDPWRDEEPGKIPHELRRGELAAAGTIPFCPYFGTVDGTPLWLLVLGEYVQATGDLALARELLPNLERALGWIDRALDARGFLAYRSRSEAGLVNQGWKDSWDGLSRADGSLPRPPIALVEAQAYVYAAWLAAADLLAQLGQGSQAVSLRQRARALAGAFDRAFWLPERGCYAVALEADGSPVATVTSNPGHALWCGIAPPERVEPLARRLMEKDLFSGWGVRTLSNRELRFNPAGYHTGSVWPHDNALCALGLRRAGQLEALLELASGLFAASHHFPGYRTPELFCGFAHSAYGVPVRYPVACSPQAWAAASWSGLLQALLGLWPEAAEHELRIASPALPRWLEWAEVRRVRVGQAEVDLRYERVGDHTSVDVAAMRGEVRVVFVERFRG